MSELGNLIRERRKECELTLEELAKEAGVNEQTIRRIEKTSEGNWHTIKKIISALGMSIEVDEYELV